MGRSVFDPIWADQQHAGSNTEIIHVLHGRVTVQTDTYSIVGHRGDTILTPAATPHRDIFPTGSVFEVYLVQFRWPAERQLLRRYTPQQLARIPRSAKARLGDEFDRLYDEFSAALPYHEPLAAIRLLHILLCLCREADLVTVGESSQDAVRNPASRRRQIMAQAKRLIQDTYHLPLSLDDLADRLNVSPYYLSRVFSAESGFRLSDYLTGVRMQRARGLLAEGRAKIAQVAHAVGYRDSHYFARVFKAHFGLSPTAYRAKLTR